MKSQIQGGIYSVKSDEQDVYRELYMRVKAHLEDSLMLGFVAGLM